MSMRSRFALVLLLSAGAWTGPVQAAPALGQPAPALRGSFLNGQSYDLADLQGQVVIVHVWASWCAPCQAEMPALDSFMQAHAGQGVRLIALSADRPRDKDAVLKQTQNVHFQTAMLNDADENGFGRPEAIPVTYIIDRAGIVRSRLVPDPDPLTTPRLEQVIGPLL